MVFLAVFRYLMCSLKPGCFHCAEMQHPSQLQIHVLRFVKALGTNTAQISPKTVQSVPTLRQEPTDVPFFVPGTRTSTKTSCSLAPVSILGWTLFHRKCAKPSEQMLSARVKQLKTLVDRRVDIRRCALISHSFGV